MTLTRNQRLGISVGGINDDETKRGTFTQYYDGFQDTKFSNRQKNELGYDMGDLFPDSPLNIARKTVKIVQDRLSLKPSGRGLISGNADSAGFADLASDWWQAGNLDSKQSDIYEILLRDDSAVMIVEWSNGMPVFSVNQLWDGRRDSGVRLHFSEANGALDFASKFWTVQEYDEEGTPTNSRIRLNVYAVEVTKGGDETATVTRYTSKSVTSTTPTDNTNSRTAQNVFLGNPQDYELMTTEQIEEDTGVLGVENPEILPIDLLPVVYFPNGSRPESEIEIILIIQKMIAKGGLQIDTGIDYHSLPTLTTSATPPMGDDGLPADVEIPPGSILWGAGDAKRIEPGNISIMWTGGVNAWLLMIAIIKGWPSWIVAPETTTSIPSGTALQTLERSLTSEITRKQAELNTAWRTVFDIAKAYAVVDGVQVVEKSIEDGEVTETEIDIPTNATLDFVWEPPNTVNPIEDQKLRVETANAAKLPIQSIWTDILGYTQEQVDAVLIPQKQAEALLSPENMQLLSAIMQALTVSGYAPDTQADLLEGVAGMSDDRIKAIRDAGGEALPDEAEAAQRELVTDPFRNGTIQ